MYQSESRILSTHAPATPVLISTKLCVIIKCVVILNSLGPCCIHYLTGTVRQPLKVRCIIVFTCHTTVTTRWRSSAISHPVMVRLRYLFLSQQLNACYCCGPVQKGRPINLCKWHYHLDTRIAKHIFFGISSSSSSAVVLF